MFRTLTSSGLGEDDSGPTGDGDKPPVEASSRSCMVLLWM